MHHQFDAVTLIRQRAAETERIVAARHHRDHRLERVGLQRSTIRRVLNHLRSN
jgi:hypothetical protein